MGSVTIFFTYRQISLKYLSRPYPAPAAFRPRFTPGLWGLVRPFLTAFRPFPAYRGGFGGAVIWLLYTKIIHGQWGCQIFFYFFSIHWGMRGYFKVKVFKIKVFKVFFRRKASPFIDKSGAKPPIFSQNQHIKSKSFDVAVDFD